MFGHPVTLNFDRRGDVYQTNLGGFISVLIKAFLLWFLIERSQDVAYKRNSNFGISTTITNYTDLGRVSFKDQGLLIRLQVYNTKVNKFMNLADFTGYWNFEFIANKLDRVKLGNGIRTSKGVHVCNRDDYARVDRLQDYENQVAREADGNG